MRTRIGRLGAGSAHSAALLFRLILLVSQLEVALRSSEQSLPSDDAPIFPLSAERRALLWTDAVEIDAMMRS